MAQKQHGGARPGAGRKVASPEGPAEVVSASVPSGLVEKLDAIATQQGWNRSQSVTEAIRRFVKSATRKAKKA